MKKHKRSVPVSKNNRDSEDLIDDGFDIVYANLANELFDDYFASVQAQINDKNRELVKTLFAKHLSAVCPNGEINDDTLFLLILEAHSRCREYAARRMEEEFDKVYEKNLMSLCQSLPNK